MTCTVTGFYLVKQHTAVLVLLCCLLAWNTHASQDESPDVEMDPQRVNFTLANTLFAVLHELGHAIIDEFEMPILGGEEQAADTIASLILVQARKQFPGSDFPFTRSLAAAAHGQRLSWETGMEEDQLETFFWTRHKLSIQRHHDAVCLLYGSAPGELWFLPDMVAMPEFRSWDCDEEFESALRSANKLMDLARQEFPGRMARNQDFAIEFGDSTDPETAFLIAEMNNGLLPQILSSLQAVIAVPTDMSIEFRSCEYPNATWDPDENLMTICHELIMTFYRLSEDVEFPEQITGVAGSQQRQ